MPVFLDSSVIIAFHSSDDSLHQKARILMTDIVSGKHGTVFISDYIFAECVTVALRKLGTLEEAVQLGHTLLHGECTLLRATESILSSTWEIFQKRNTGKLSFTDCMNIAFVETLHLDALATFDKEFKKTSVPLLGL